MHGCGVAISPKTCAFQEILPRYLHTSRTYKELKFSDSDILDEPIEVYYYYARGISQYYKRTASIPCNGCNSNYKLFETNYKDCPKMEEFGKHIFLVRTIAASNEPWNNASPNEMRLNTLYEDRALFSLG